MKEACVTCQSTTVVLHGCVVYVGMGLDFYQILYRQILRVKGRVAFRWVIYAATNQITYLIKKDFKTI